MNKGWRNFKIMCALLLYISGLAMITLLNYSLVNLLNFNLTKVVIWSLSSNILYCGIVCYKLCKWVVNNE